jgi:hypothetical protein
MNIINDFYNMIVDNKNVDNKNVELDKIQEIIHKYVHTNIVENGENYSIVKVYNDLTMKLFVCYIVFYNTYSKNKKVYDKIIGLDYEFDKGNIALHQLSFYPNNKKNVIFLVDPGFITGVNRHMLVKYVYASKCVKILHGSDSLDIPYIFNKLMKRNRKVFLKFVETIYDTRFMCEMNKILNNVGNIKCSLYDAMLFFGTLDNNKYDELTNINKKMGPIYNVVWNVIKLDGLNLKYALYDVLFLRKFVYDIIDRSQKGKVLSAVKLIPYIERFIYVEKQDSIIMNYVKQIIDKINNFEIHLKSNKRLVEFFNNDITNITITKSGVTLNNIMNISYFKGTIVYLFKFVLYSILFEKYEIYESKNVKHTGVCDRKTLFKMLKKDGFKIVYKILREFEKTVLLKSFS